MVDSKEALEVELTGLDNGLDVWTEREESRMIPGFCGEQLEAAF